MATQDDVISTVYTNLDPSLDQQKGPLKRLFLDPHRAVVSYTKTSVDRLIALFTQQRPDNMTSEEYDAITKPWGGINRFLGLPAFGTVTVYAYTKPAADFVIPFGTVFSDDTGSLLYQASAELRVAVGDLDRYFNPTNRRFEFDLTIIAKEVGSDFAVPAGRITKIVSDIPFASGVINQKALTGGLPVESDSSIDSRFRARLEGTDRGSSGWISFTTLSVAGVQSVALIAPGHQLFSRRTARPAIDVYVIGDNILQATYSVVVTDPTRRSYQILSPEGNARRATSIVRVVQNSQDTITNWSFVPDTTRMGQAVNAATYVEFTAGFPLDTRLDITYEYNYLLELVQANLEIQDGTTGTYLFNTDMLAFAAKPVALEVDFTLNTLSSTNQVYLQQQVQNVTMELLNQLDYVGQLTPTQFITDLQAQVPAASPVLHKFKRKDDTQLVGVITLSDIEFPQLASADLVIR
jgi:hypothetical protein